MDHLESNGVHVVTFNTNGYLLDEKMAQFLVEKGKTFEHFRISFSLDAATPKTYDRIRGKDLDRTLKNIRSLQDCKRRAGADSPSLFLNMTLSRTNVKDLPKFIELAHEIGVSVELNNLALDKNYETIRVQKSAGFQFDYKKEILTAYPNLYNKYLRKADRLGEQLKVPVYKAGDVARMEEPPGRWTFLKRFGQGMLNRSKALINVDSFSTQAFRDQIVQQNRTAVPQSCRMYGWLLLLNTRLFGAYRTDTKETCFGYRTGKGCRCGISARVPIPAPAVPGV